MESCNELTELANRFGSDKGNAAYQKHHYTRVYGEYFEKYRNRSIEVCEIGLLHPWAKATAGGSYDCAPSLQMWHEYFHKARITGFDIDDFSAIKGERLRIVRGDQSRREDLAQLAFYGRVYDIIIDDGSHASHHQQITLGYMFKYLRSGGLYFIEDLAYQPPDLEAAGATKTLAVLETLKSQGNAESSYFLPEEKHYLEENVATIAFYDSCASIAAADSLAVLVKK